MKRNNLTIVNAFSIYFVMLLINILQYKKTHHINTISLVGCIACTGLLIWLIIELIRGRKK